MQWALYIFVFFLLTSKFKTKSTSFFKTSIAAVVAVLDATAVAAVLSATAVAAVPVAAAAAVDTGDET